MMLREIVPGYMILEGEGQFSGGTGHKKVTKV
jgi:hypothetical protein